MTRKNSLKRSFFFTGFLKLISNFYSAKSEWFVKVYHFLSVLAIWWQAGLNEAKSAIERG